MTAQSLLFHLIPTHFSVIPAKAGIHRAAGRDLETGVRGGMGPGLRRDDVLRSGGCHGAWV